MAGGDFNPHETNSTEHHKKARGFSILDRDALSGTKQSRNLTAFYRLRYTTLDSTLKGVLILTLLDSASLSSSLGPFGGKECQVWMIRNHDGSSFMRKHPPRPTRKS